MANDAELESPSALVAVTLTGALPVARHSGGLQVTTLEYASPTGVPSQPALEDQLKVSALSCGSYAST